MKIRYEDATLFAFLGSFNDCSKMNGDHFDLNANI